MFNKNTAFYEPYLDKIQKCSNSIDSKYALIGGSLIGISCSSTFLFLGRIAGLSGMFNSLITFGINSGLYWKFPFLSGLALSSYGAYKFFGPEITLEEGKKYKIFDTAQETKKGISNLGFIVGGFLVGLGTKLGNGCTSGHAVCGLGRLSKRSFVATLVFMTTGVLTATFRDRNPFLFKDDFKILGFIRDIMNGKPKLKEVFPHTRPEQYYYQRDLSKENAVYDEVKDILSNHQHKRGVELGLAASLGASTALLGVHGKYSALAFLNGLIFGGGLTISGMCRRSKINSFLTLNENWDPSLLFVMAGAVGVTLVCFNLGLRVFRKPFFMPKFDLPSFSGIDKRVIIGPALFGAGWGLSGFCPGPAIVNMLISPNVLVFFIPSMATGQWTGSLVIKLLK